ncbi:MAG: class A beta-lactamase-related serine hydrolase [Bacteroidetes bacterium]|nr:MAG: class A beta-lactamase-related serine hydrolase [Bacteroidota bacterium]
MRQNPFFNGEGGSRIRFRMIGIFLVTIGFLVLSGSAASAQLVTPSTVELEELDARIKAHMADNNIPGGLVAVASRGQIVHLKTYGLANVELAVPVNDSTVFEIGSISKQFVTAVVMMQVQEGRLAVDDPIQKHLSDLPSEWVGVTVRQLMTHTSGIPDYEEIRTYDVYRYRMTPQDVIAIAQSRPMDFEPGTGYYYSNTGYYLLSMIVERVDGAPLGRILKNRIFGPLGMTQTRLADPEAIILHRAAGYWVNRRGELINRNPTETSSTLGAGGILSSAYDLAKWDESLYGNQLLTDESKQALWKSTILPDGTDTGYGFGWRVTPYKGLASQSHGGQVGGFVANFSRFPEQDVAVIVFLNRYRVSSGVLKEAVLQTFMPSTETVPR